MFNEASFGDLLLYWKKLGLFVSFRSIHVGLSIKLETSFSLQKHHKFIIRSKFCQDL